MVHPVVHFQLPRLRTNILGLGLCGFVEVHEYLSLGRALDFFPKSSCTGDSNQQNVDFKKFKMVLLAYMFSFLVNATGGSPVVGQVICLSLAMALQIGSCFPKCCV